MSITATEFRKDLFNLLEKVSNGQPLEIVYKGSKLKLAAVENTSKLSRLKPHDIFLCDPDSIIQTDPELMAEMEAAWEEDWRDL